MKFCFFMALLMPFVAQAQTEKVYDLRVHHHSMNVTGEPAKHVLAINGSIPGPTLRFKKGDIAVINVQNATHEATSVHWHGVLVPWNMDGPSFYNNKIIQPGHTFTFRFPIKHTGTFWYHSHTMFQEQSGLYGSIVIEDEGHSNHADHDLVMVLSDWTNEDPHQVMRNLKSDGDYYAAKKNFFPSVLGAIRHGAIWDYIKGEWSRMGPMDLSDVAYDAFLINGKKAYEVPNIRPGQKVRLRIINAGASSYFYVNLGNLRCFNVISKDGVNVVPVSVNEILIGTGETYDVIFTMPDMGHPMGLEFRATAQDITGYGSVVLGSGHIEKVPDKIRPNPYKMDEHSGHGGGSGGDGGHGGHGAKTRAKMTAPSCGEPPDDDEPPDGDEPPDEPSMPMSERLSLSQLKSPTPTVFDASLPRKDIHLALSGDMERYNWTINGKPFSKEKYIMVRHNDVIRMTFDNKTMMHHPMHLHGHFFRVLNGQGDYAPNIHTVDVPPMQSITIEFWANEPGIWFLHCHNLYHMEMGMARLVKYDGFELPEELVQEHKVFGKKYDMNDAKFFFSGEAGVYTNRSELHGRLSGGAWDISLELEMDKYDPDTFKGELLFKRYLSQYFALVSGGEYEDRELAAILGMAQTLPLNIGVMAYMRSDGKMVVKLSKRVPIYGRLSLEIEPEISRKGGKNEVELQSRLSYQLSQRSSVGIFYKQSDKVGKSIGFGMRTKF